jgi:C-terminal processing protease CtpA/Prc
MFSSGKAHPSVLEVLSGSPAEEAGLRQNDYVLSIGGWSTENASMEEVVRRLRGDAGTVVELEVRAPDYDGITIYEDENATMPERKVTITRRDLTPYQSTLRQRIEQDVAK